MFLTGTVKGEVFLVGIVEVYIHLFITLALDGLK